MNLKNYLAGGGNVTAPGVFDPFSALVAERAGFPVLYMTGYGVNATLLGLPDAGFASYHQMSDRLRSITQVTDASIIADGDTGFGGLANVELAVRGYEMSGADAIQLEDQEFPKRCGHTRNRKVIDTVDMVKKVGIACEARYSEDFLVIARTDALTEHGLDEALRRADAYLNAGADVLFVESPDNEVQMRAICDRFKGVPLVANMVAGGKTPQHQDAVLFEMGYSIVIHPIYLLGAMSQAMTQAASDLLSDTPKSVDDIHGLNDILDFQHVWDLDDR